MVSAKTGIQAELSEGGLVVGQVLLFEAFKALPQDFDFIQQQLATGLGLVQFALSNIERFFATFPPLQGCLGSLA